MTGNVGTGMWGPAPGFPSDDKASRFGLQVHL
jgi:hypothetical protein